MQGLDGHLSRVLFDAATIERRVAELGDEISRDYAGRPLYLVVILNGAFMFCADLIRHLKLDVQVGFMVVSSYGESTKTSGTVRIVKDLQRDISGWDVLFVEDIVDTGLTIAHLHKLLSVRNPRSLKTCALLNKASCRRVEIPVDYVGFEIPNEFVVGYGLDYDQRYRQLPLVGVLDPAHIKKAHGGEQ